MDFFQKLSVVWQGVSLVQRALLIAIILTFVTAGVFLSRWAGRPDMRLLYSQLDPEEAGKITEKISEKNVPYKLRNGGTTIYVPSEEVAQLRLDMAKDGLPCGGQKGYGIFDNEKIGVPPFTQKINLNRALQDELAKSIQMIDGVTYARIHIVNPEQTLFRAGEQQSTASVVIKLKGGYKLSPSTIAAITHLVAGGVKDLQAGNVTVVDSQGHLLSRDTDPGLDNGAGTVQDYRERVEKNLESKAEEMLCAVLGPGRATVKVSAIIDMNSVSTLTETPIKGMPQTEEITTTTESKSGTSSEGKTIEEADKKSDETTVTEYLHGKTIKEEVVLPGRVTSLSVAAFVDLTAPLSADANETAGGGQAAKIMEISDVEDCIKNALGLKATDSLKVVEARFPRPLEAVSDESEGGLDLVAIAGQASMGLMAICALLALKVLSGGKKKSKTAVKGQTAEAELLEAEQPAGLLPTGDKNQEPVMLRRQIASALESNPEQVKQLFSSWLSK